MAMQNLEVELSKKDMKRESDHCWTVNLDSRFASGDSLDEPLKSPLQLFENGRPLGPPHSLHDDIRQTGGGRFSHWGKALMFSTSDNADPSQSTRRYSVRAPQAARELKLTDDALPDSRIACPCCGFTKQFRPYATRLDVAGNRVRFFTCQICTSLVNMTNVSEALSDLGASEDMQEEASRVFYPVDDAVRDLAGRLELHRGLLDWFLQSVETTNLRRAIELGAGLGFLSAAACSHFDEVWALEINRSTLDRMVPHFGLADRLKIGSHLDEVPGTVDAVFAWHTLEHIPKLWEVGQSVADKLNPGGYFFWQVPMYADPYVVSSHYTFLNEHAAAVFSDRIGLRVEKIWNDEPNQFLTCLARKPG
ncbi:class I SAM-dependent methyltransferase [Methylobacterium sp. NMS14P]|uniref:class I SAM-dependent methyltransferase n=1 Tax=Methylobacterium sp. NMS14P TaxID=2894310 RepID=UPI002359ED65|nr:class I SAM-dependent methyltransferase [Methylobacterium sp. NMS14P]WCS26433.1 class I SAM-dependent methyltransferase [Methylobacterium sp. NMS14P]